MPRSSSEAIRGVAWDDGFWIDSLSLGAVHDLSGDDRDEPPTLLVPDGAGDYREHVVAPPPKRRMGF